MSRKEKKEIDRVCHYCEFASPLHDEDFMICERFGVVSSDHVCHRFSYDPLKRVPAPIKVPSLDGDAPDSADGL